MNPWLFLGMALAAITLALWIPRYRLQRAIAAPFPPEWVEILEQNIRWELVHRGLRLGQFFVLGFIRYLRIESVE